MAGGRGYDIFPRTFKARFLLALAFVGGLGLIGGFVALSILTGGVLDEIDVTVENRTSRDVTVFVDGRSEAVVPAGDTTTFATPKIVWRFNKARVQAIASNGILVLEEEMDLDDLERHDYRIVIPGDGGREGAASPGGQETPEATPQATPALEDVTYPPCTIDLVDCLAAQEELRAGALSSCGGSARRVCFVPLGQVDPELVRQLVDYYFETYGLEIGVLAPGAIPAELVHPVRQQIDGQTLAEYIGTLYPQDFETPGVALIGLTPLDLYAADRDWRFQMGIASWGLTSHGVVSSYRMHLGEFDLVDEGLWLERVRKLVTKYIGLMVYQLSLSERPESPMFGGILSVSDLDVMTEPLPVEDAR